SAAATWDGWGTALKPAWEPIILAMKPRDGTFANNALTWGVAGLNVDGGRIGLQDGETTWGSGCSQSNAPATAYGDMDNKRVGVPNILSTQGRWPANLLLDEESARMLGEQSGESGATIRNVPKSPLGRAKFDGTYNNGQRYDNTSAHYGGFPDTGTAARFFYTAKAPKREKWFYCAICDDAYPVSLVDEHEHGRPPKERKHIVRHPTQKPLDLMRYLVRLTKTPTGGVVLDMFVGSGSTGEACVEE
ncbi:unnamed protein product, partial [marine sediment metagenome]